LTTKKLNHRFSLFWQRATRINYINWYNELKLRIIFWRLLMA